MSLECSCASFCIVAQFARASTVASTSTVKVTTSFIRPSRSRGGECSPISEKLIGSSYTKGRCERRMSAKCISGNFTMRLQCPLNPSEETKQPTCTPNGNYNCCNQKPYGPSTIE